MRGRLFQWDRMIWVYDDIEPRLEVSNNFVAPFWKSPHVTTWWFMGS